MKRPPKPHQQRQSLNKPKANDQDKQKGPGVIPALFWLSIAHQAQHFLAAAVVIKEAAEQV